MKGYLLDTNVVLLAVHAPEELSPASRHALRRGPAWLSLMSYWEVTIKARLGKIEVGDPRVWWPESLRALDGHELPLRSEHIAAIWPLPPLHRDPFDRVLVAQAIAEGMTLVSQDRNVQQYGSAGCRVVG